MALILPYRNHIPEIAPTAFIAENATIIGNTVIGPGSSIWYGCILRGDVNEIRVGARTNIQDGTVVHVARNGWPATIGDDVLIGHMALIHACRIEDGAMVGMGACVMDGAVVEARAMVAAGALVSPGKRISKGELWAGRPAKFMRLLSEEDQLEIAAGIRRYADLAQEYLAAQKLRAGNQ